MVENNAMENPLNLLTAHFRRGPAESCESDCVCAATPEEELLHCFNRASLLIGNVYSEAARVVSGWLVFTDIQRSSNIECSQTIIVQLCGTRGGVYGKAAYRHGVGAVGDVYCTIIECDRERGICGARDIE